MGNIPSRGCNQRSIEDAGAAMARGAGTKRHGNRATILAGEVILTSTWREDPWDNGDQRSLAPITCFAHVGATLGQF